jgi:hypothetical protein
MLQMMTLVIAEPFLSLALQKAFMQSNDTSFDL